ncbi:MULTISPECIES: hypothetical protein [unclassified Nostoc]|uniref:hypothetical protein n=1 Tax=unclassified Nostoc TaxID=2593658 RepID=UPI002AD31C5E|nr:hypothetical protein [Nostoc sp. DedQUE03]MDZ7977221.1 hypothetical protein [Nostoc sp. DedQUE03]MDZ8047658.1 hypothetical protein [Nostoc sp. DedQUE02]
MDRPALDLLNQNNWVQIYDESRTAVIATQAGGYYPIPAFEIPIQLEKHILAARCISTTAKSTWRWAGNLIQKIAPPIAGINSPLVEAGSYSMKLNRTRLVIFKPYTDTFQLTLEGAYWLKDLRLTLWQYQGIEGDSTEEIITSLGSDLNRIEAKIDAL